MLDILFVFPPIMVLFITSIIKIINSELELRGFGFDAHIIGIMYIYPLPFLFPDKLKEFLIVLLFVSLMLAITTECWVKSKEGKSPKETLLGGICFFLGTLVFLMGFFWSIIL